MKLFIIFFFLFSNSYCNVNKSQYELVDKNDYRVYKFEKHGTETMIEITVKNFTVIESLTLINIPYYQNRFLVSAIAEIEYIINNNSKFDKYVSIINLNNRTICIKHIWYSYLVDLPYKNEGINISPDSNAAKAVDKELKDILPMIFSYLYKIRALK